MYFVRTVIVQCKAQPEDSSRRHTSQFRYLKRSHELWPAGRSVFCAL